MKNIKKFGSIRLKKEYSRDASCDGCYFKCKIKSCSRPYDHMGVFKCVHKYEGEWIEDEDSDEGGYFENIEEFFIWAKMKEMNSKTKVI